MSRKAKILGFVAGIATLLSPVATQAHSAKKSNDSKKVVTTTIAPGISSNNANFAKIAKDLGLDKKTLVVTVQDNQGTLVISNNGMIYFSYNDFAGGAVVRDGCIEYFQSYTAYDENSYEKVEDSKFIKLMNSLVIENAPKKSEIYNAVQKKTKATKRIADNYMGHVEYSIGVKDTMWKADMTKILDALDIYTKNDGYYYFGDGFGKQKSMQAVRTSATKARHKMSMFYCIYLDLVENISFDDLSVPEIEFVENFKTEMEKYGYRLEKNNTVSVIKYDNNGKALSKKQEQEKSIQDAIEQVLKKTQQDAKKRKPNQTTNTRTM